MQCPPSASEWCSYAVTIVYREPTYNRRRANSPSYQWTFRVAAPDVDSARQTAIDEFERLTALSGVGWVRQVVGTIVLPAC